MVSMYAVGVPCSSDTQTPSIPSIIDSHTFRCKRAWAGMRTGQGPRRVQGGFSRSATLTMPWAGRCLLRRCWLPQRKIRKLPALPDHIKQAISALVDAAKPRKRAGFCLWKIISDNSCKVCQTVDTTVGEIANA